MRIGIICAGDLEIAPFLPLITECQTSEKAMLTFYEGKLNGHDVVALYCGVCKVNAALATQILIDTYHVELVINAGTAGAICSDLRLFDTVIGTQVAYHDVAPDLLTEFHPWMDSIYFTSDATLVELTKDITLAPQVDTTIYWGKIVTGESFITDDRRDEINAAFVPLAVDMETASIAHVCYVNTIPFIGIRSITDTPEERGVNTFELNCQKASDTSMQVVCALLDRLAA